MKAQVNSFLQKEVSRKEFLGMSGLAVASLFGFGTAIKLLTGKSLDSQHVINSGFGSGAYGGFKK